VRIALFAAAITLLSCATPAPPPSPPPETHSPEDAAAILAMASPGPEHTRLAVFEGVWRHRGTFSIQGQAPLYFTGTTTNRMILGGRFLESRSATAEGPFPIESFTVFGFDRRSSDFTAVGFDSLGTYHVTAAGKPAPESQPITMSGVNRDPATGRVEEFDFVLTPINPNEYRFDVFFKGPGGARSHVVEIIHTRETN
jgi:hypothetical protein